MTKTSSLPELLQTVADGQDLVEHPKAYIRSRWYDLGSRFPMFGQVACLYRVDGDSGANQVSLVAGVEVPGIDGYHAVAPAVGLAIDWEGGAHIWAPELGRRVREEAQAPNFMMFPAEFPVFTSEHEVSLGGVRQVLEGIHAGILLPLPNRPFSLFQNSVLAGS